MRFNPPPSWPTAPEGWSPPPGWQPDPSWPPPPYGWPLWLDDSSDSGRIESPGIDSHRQATESSAGQQIVRPEVLARNELSNLSAEGYGVAVSVSGPMLTASATNIASRGAFGAKERVIDIRSLRAATWTAASALKNGRIDLVTDHGKTVLHFRKKQQSQMRVIFDAILAAAPPQATGPTAKNLVDAAPFAHDKATATELRSERADDARELAELIGAARTYDGGTPEEVRASGFIIQPDEKLYGIFVNAMLIEPRRAPGHYAGSSAGLSFRLAKGVQYRVGQQRGVFQPGPESPTVIDHGDLAITTRRVIFRGLKQSREWEFAKLLGVEHAKDGSWSSLSVRNRQKTSGFGYSADIADAVRFRFELALSTYRGDREAYLTQLENELRTLRQE